MNFKFLLIFLFISVASFTLFLTSNFIITSINQNLVNARRIETKNQGLILADKISSSLYISSDERSMETDSQIETLADILDARIVIIDYNFNVIRDTYAFSLGKKSVAKEVIKTFNGYIIDEYSKKNDYIVQTFPVYKKGEDLVEGVILITSSTEDFKTILDLTSDNVLMFSVIYLSLISICSFILGKIMIRPFDIVKEKIENIANGNLSLSINEETYTLTDEISKNINASLEKLKNINETREEFVANVSHELKTPITSIRVLADSLISMSEMGEVPTDLYKEFMEDISFEIDRESKIIDDLLSLVKIDDINSKLITEQVDINHQIGIILKRLRPIADSRNIELIFESIRNVEAWIDETKFSIAITNLVENAIKYNLDGGNVKVSLDADHKFFYIKVIDSGIGIPEDLQELVFDRFYRVDKARSRETGGTGLGLAITKSFIQKHNGIIKLSSKEGEGTIFTVRMPLNQKG